MNPIRKLFPNESELLDYANFDWKSLSIKPYLILFTGRSGSTLLTEQMVKLGYGNPAEHFSELNIPYVKKYARSDRFYDFFSYIVTSQSKNGYFGVEIDALRFFWISSLINFNNVFSPMGKIPIIWLIRQNILAQAYSFAVAKRTGIWHIFESKKNNKLENSQDVVVQDQDVVIQDQDVVIQDQDIVIQDCDIWKELILILRYEQKIENLFLDSGVVPLRITYEQLILDQAMVFGMIMSYLSVSTQEGEIAKKIDDVLACPEPVTKMVYSEREDKLIVFYSRYSKILNRISMYRKSIDVDEIIESVRENGLEIY